MAVPLETIFGSEMVSYGTDNGSEMVSFHTDNGSEMVSFGTDNGSEMVSQALTPGMFCTPDPPRGCFS